VSDTLCKVQSELNDTAADERFYEAVVQCDILNPNDTREFTVRPKTFVWFIPTYGVMITVVADGYSHDFLFDFSESCPDSNEAYCFVSVKHFGDASPYG
jgi:hypothetical protein